MKPNILFVILDSVRARNTSIYNHVNNTTPFLETFAKKATTFTQARAPSTWSLPSHVSMFTGLYPCEHNITSRGQRLESGHTIWEDLSDEHGYATGVFSSNPFLTVAPVGLNEAFEHSVGTVDFPFEDAINPREFARKHGEGSYIAFLRKAISSRKPIPSLINGLYEKLNRSAPRLLPGVAQDNKSGFQFAEAFLDWEAGQSDSWAACVNLMDAHLPYQPTPEYDIYSEAYLHELQSEIDSMWEFNGGQRQWWQRQALEALYDGSIRQADAVVEQIISQLERRDELTNTLVIIAGDHGEGFGEPSNLKPSVRAVDHGNGGSHEVLLHVPLMIKMPKQCKGSVVDTTCSLTHLPIVINSVIEESEARFPPDEPVIASGYGLNDRMRRVASKYCDDLSSYEGEIRIHYESTQSGIVRKQAKWQSEEVTVTIRNAQTCYQTANSIDETIESTFGAFEVQKVSSEASEVGADVQKRLEELGYA